MVITIKNIPVLEGATAEDFVRNAEKNAVKVTPQVVRGGQETATKGIGEIPFIPDSTNNGRDFLYTMIASCLPI